MNKTERLIYARQLAGYEHASEAAAAMNIPAPTYQAHENGTRGFDKHATRYADFFKVSLEWLVRGRGNPRHGVELLQSGEGSSSESQTENKKAEIVQIPIVGKVAAGVLIEPHLSYKGAADLKPFPVSPFPPDQNYPISAQFDLVVDGTSINKFAREGERLRCVDLEKSEAEWSDGDLVIVQHRKFDGQLIETTAKRVRRRQDAIELWPESDDPMWQDPLVIRPADLAESDELSIVALVLWSYKPAR